MSLVLFHCSNITVSYFKNDPLKPILLLRKAASPVAPSSGSAKESKKRKHAQASGASLDDLGGVRIPSGFVIRIYAAISASEPPFLVRKLGPTRNAVREYKLEVAAGYVDHSQLALSYNGWHSRRYSYLSGCAHQSRACQRRRLVLAHSLLQYRGVLSSTS